MDINTNNSVCVRVQDYSTLDSASLTEALELIEHTRDVLDDVWKQNEHAPYSETRMRRLMDVTGLYVCVSGSMCVRVYLSRCCCG